MNRCSGILMPVFSLPSPYGIGTLGKAAYDFADFLHAAGQHCWQMLPLGPTSYGDSPYQSFSTYAGNPYFIDLELLIEDGLLTRDEVESQNWGTNPRYVDYGRIYESRFAVLQKAKDRGWERDQAEVAAFGDGCAYVNREDDAGDRGLRTSKLQYGPAKLAPKYHFLPQNELLRHVSAIPELKTERLTLSAITETDIPAYNALVLDSDRNRWWGYDDVGGLGAPVTERSFYDVARRDFENRMAVNFAVRLNGTLIGEAVLYNFDYRGSAELGCRIDKAYAGNGYGTEAFRCAAEWGLYQVNLSRIVAKCYKENEASYKMLSACMRRNGEDETFFYFEKLV